MIYATYYNNTHINLMVNRRNKLEGYAALDS